MYNVVVFTESCGYESAGACRNLAYFVLTMPSLRSWPSFFILLPLAFMIELFMAWITLYFSLSLPDVEQLLICLCCEVDDHVIIQKLTQAGLNIPVSSSSPRCHRLTGGHDAFRNIDPPEQFPSRTQEELSPSHILLPPQ